MNEFAFRNGQGFKRFANKNEIHIPYGKSLYSKHVNAPYTRISQLFNSKGESVGVDIIEMKEETIEVIYNRTKRIVIVILQNSKGEKFKGTSRCHADDLFNPEIGYQIAHARATIKLKAAKLEGFIKE